MSYDYRIHTITVCTSNSFEQLLGIKIILGLYNTTSSSFYDGKTIKLDPIGQMTGNCVNKMITSPLVSLEVGYNSTRVTRIRWKTNNMTFASSNKVSPKLLKTFNFTDENPLIGVWGT